MFTVASWCLAPVAQKKIPVNTKVVHFTKCALWPSVLELLASKWSRIQRIPITSVIQRAIHHLTPSRRHRSADLFRLITSGPVATWDQRMRHCCQRDTFSLSFSVSTDTSRSKSSIIHASSVSPLFFIMNLHTEKDASRSLFTCSFAIDANLSYNCLTRLGALFCANCHIPLDTLLFASTAERLG